MRDLRLAPPLLFLAAVACTAPGDRTPPALELPVTTAAAEDLTEWWRRFDDERLDALLRATLTQNGDLAAAAARVQEAAALVRNVDDLLPDANLTASAGRNQTSDKNAFPRFAGIDRINAAHSVGLDVTWELDLWGRIRAGGDAALADLQQNHDNMQALRASLAAQIAQTYFRLVAIDRHLELTTSTLQNRRDALAILQRRQQAGTSTTIELRQAEAEVESVAGALPRLQQAQAATQRALLVLAGEAPAALATPSVDRRADLPSPPPVPAGLPSDLLARRPDVRAAEAGLAAASARVDEARSHYFPTIRLTGNIGQESESLSNLFLGPATAWAFASSLAQPLFGLRKIDAQVDAAAARRQQSEASYVQTVRNAFREAYDALGTRRAAHETMLAQQRRIDALLEVERIATARHTAGAGTFLELLDAQRQLLAVQQDHIDSATDELVATVDVYRALGGGWDSGSNP